MLAVATRSLEKRSAVQAVRLLHTRSACLVNEKDGTGAGGAAKVIVTPAATATIIAPNTQPNTHYTSTVPPTPAAPTTAATTATAAAKTITPPPPPPPQPTQQKPVVVAAAPPSSPPSAPYSQSAASSYPRARSSIRSRLTAFLVGVGVAAGAGYYRLQSDVWSSARALEGQIEGLRVAHTSSGGGSGAGSAADNKALADTVAALERRVAELEKDKGRK